ncbi:MAG: DNA-processing protein DprA, partial [Ruthenibacterium sp.]
ASGVLISEYPPGTEALGRHFPIRNRIISGLCLATLVVEAPEHSGALITAGTALEQSRDVFAVPGPIDAPMSRGCNHLIREGAGLCADSWDILREYATRYPNNLTPQIYELPETLAYVGQKKPVETGAPKRPILSLSHNEYSLTDDQIRLLRAMGDTPVQADDLIELTQIPARRVLSALTLMELEDLVSQQSGKHFLRLVTLAE